MSYICSLLLVSYTCRLTLVPYILVSDICVGVNCFSQRRSGRRFREDGVDALQRVLGAEGAFSDGGDAAFRADAEGAFGDACGVAVQVLESQIFLVLPGRELDGGGEDIGTLMLKGIGQWTRCGDDAPAGGEVEAGDASFIAKSGYVGVEGAALKKCALHVCMCTVCLSSCVLRIFLRGALVFASFVCLCALYVFLRGTLYVYVLDWTSHFYPSCISCFMSYIVWSYSPSPHSQDTSKIINYTNLVLRLGQVFVFLLSLSLFSWSTLLDGAWRGEGTCYLGGASGWRACEGL